MHPAQTNFLDDLDDEKSEISTITTPSMNDLDDTLIINVGGQRHEILRSTLNSKPGTKFTNKPDLELHYRHDKQEYYYDRNPHVFTSIVNYLRTDELHAPIDVCGAVFKKELIFWGIDDHEIQQCCWIRYCSDLDTKQTLNRFNNKVVPCDALQVHQTRWEIFRKKVWDFFDKPYSSLAAKVYACISLLVIIASITVFCAGSFPSLKQDMTAEHYAEYYDQPRERFSDDGYYYYDYYYDYYDGHRNRRDTSGEYNTKQGHPTTKNDGAGEDTGKVNRMRNNYEKKPVIDTKVAEEQYNEKKNGVQEEYTRDKRNTEFGDMDYMYDNETDPSKKKVDLHLSAPHPVLDGIDCGCVAFFTLELLAMFCFSPYRLRFFISPLNIIDIVALLPFYVELIVNNVMTSEKYKHSIVDVLFLLQVLRILRVFRLIRHVKGLRVLMYTVKYGWREMALMLLFLAIGMLCFGTLIFYTDYRIGQFKSIPHGFWWAIITMTTVGYGDLHPQTNWGYFVGSLCAFTGVLVIAFSVPSLVNNFMLFYRHVQYEKPPRCCRNHTLKQNSLSCQGTTDRQNTELRVETLETLKVPQQNVSY